jgi:hypothetical protein
VDLGVLYENDFRVIQVISYENNFHVIQPVSHENYISCNILKYAKVRRIMACRNI